MAKLAAGVALLLVRMFAIAGHVASFPAVVTQVLPLPFGLLAVPGNVATLVAVVACCGEKSTIYTHRINDCYELTSCQLELRRNRTPTVFRLITVPGDVSVLSTAIAELVCDDIQSV